jgi:hypothetical protein
MLLRDLPNWPPTIGARGEVNRFPDSTEDLLIGVYPPNDKHVTFDTTFEGHEFRRHFAADSAALAGKLTDLLISQAGRTVKGLGELKLD